MKSKFLLIASIITFIVVACSKIMPPEPDPEAVLAGPVEDLSPQQMANHIKGDEEFSRVFGVSDGLGPIFVAASCESCHAGDGKGHPSTTLTRFGKYNGPTWDPMISEGGPQLQHFSISGYPAEQVPSGIFGMTRLVAPAVTGLGYLEAIEDAAILALADAADANADGISGVPSYIAPPNYFIAKYHHQPVAGKYIGRFGKKAGAIDLTQQTANAYLNDIGITSDFNMQDLYNVQTGNNTGDNVPDPEVSASTVHNVAFYMRTLKLPPRRNAKDAKVLQGEQIFLNIGCGGCHTPTLTTGNSDIAALSNKVIHPYTDLLLHDMGNELNDNYTEGSAQPAEWRTPPLWGIGLTKDSQGGQMFLLHDGRAKTFEEAINYHGGESSGSRTAFQNLTQSEKEALIKFLESL
ncbi:MAG: thiol oxidoreductase [Cytophagaceae bacterium]|nr:thiol oxidoreductase [Cytophagaceae bacterium]